MRDRGAGLRELAERDHLVGGVHRDTHDVLRERQLDRIAVRGDLARHRMEGVEPAFLDECNEGRESLPAGDDCEALGAVRGGFVGRCLAHVLGRGRELAKRDVPDRRFQRGAMWWFMPFSVDGWTGARETAFSGRRAPARPRPHSTSTR